MAPEKDPRCKPDWKKLPGERIASITTMLIAGASATEAAVQGDVKAVAFNSALFFFATVVALWVASDP